MLDNDKFFKELEHKFDIFEDTISRLTKNDYADKMEISNQSSHIQWYVTRHLYNIKKSIEARS